jgi:ketosteroid isomerase-like protein
MDRSDGPHTVPAINSWRMAMGETMDLARKSIELMDKRDLKGLRALLSPDFTFWEPATGTLDADGFIGYMGNYAEAVPTASTERKSEAESGNVAIIEAAVSLKHTGPLHTPKGTIPPTGRSLVLPYCHYVRAEAGKITALKFYYDQITFLTGLGLLPEPVAA